MTSDAAAMKPHVSIFVRDVEKSTAFYRRMFGAEPVKVRRGYAKFDVAQPALNFVINQAKFSGPGALSHLGLQVATTEEVLKTRQRWLDAGLEVRDEMKTDCCYAIQDKSWVSDPDGNQWEVFVVLEDQLPEKPAASDVVESCCTPTSTCCTPACRPAAEEGATAQG
ncbi:MAG TPA: ArsI/CadI family heavy metal resistance metalloenzyme [Terriglobales bacterium]|nr:ArsI/CadI family heavy metal resistance metalloenzyme [Terriglobales bacterium]